MKKSNFPNDSFQAARLIPSPRRRRRPVSPPRAPRTPPPPAARAAPCTRPCARPSWPPGMSSSSTARRRTRSAACGRRRRTRNTCPAATEAPLRRASDGRTQPGRGRLSNCSPAWLGARLRRWPAPPPKSRPCDRRPAASDGLRCAAQKRGRCKEPGEKMRKTVQIRMSNER